MINPNRSFERPLESPSWDAFFVGPLPQGISPEAVQILIHIGVLKNVRSNLATLLNRINAEIDTTSRMSPETCFVAQSELKTALATADAFKLAETCIRDWVRNMLAQIDEQPKPQPAPAPAPAQAQPKKV
jgi:hypothetical protein